MSGLQFLAECPIRHTIDSRISYRAEDQALARFVNGQEFGQIEIGMFQRIEPLSLFLWDMLRDDVAQLLDQRQLPVLRIEIGVQEEVS